MYELKISECCIAPVYDETNICTECNKECTVLLECPHCNTGQAKLGNHKRLYKFKCVYCKGTGYLNEERKES